VTLPGTVQTADDGILGFDTNRIVTGAMAADFFAEGFRFCVRYVSRTAKQGPDDLSTSEAINLLSAGLAPMPVQHVRADGWLPSPELGALDGVHAAYHAFVVGFPTGVNLWCDLEGVSVDATAQQVIGYSNAWYDAVSTAGYVPGLYVGAGTNLDGHDLRFRLKFLHYWKSLSDVPEIAGRGYQMVQSHEQVVNGISIDKDRCQTDLLGGKVLLLSPILSRWVT
jgi:hypothetical protein